jgi:CubicO group peptidase (beta-lactamase class C family)
VSQFAGSLLLGWFLLAQTAVAGTYYPPPESKGGWRTLVMKNAVPTADQKSAVLNAAGLDTDRLVDAWNYVAGLGQRQSLLVIRRGWIVGEWDYVGIGPVNSSTKSLTGLALAKLFELSDAGRLPRKIGYDDLAYHYLPTMWSDSDPRKKLIKVRDLPTMCSGLQPMDRGIRDVNMALALPVIHPPETVDQYSSAAVCLEGMVIENASGQTLKNFFRQYISEPIGAESVRLWDAYGAAGYAFMHTRDFARFGYLMLHHGAWDDGGGLQQLVRPDLIARCTQWPTFLMNVTDGPGNNTQWLTTNDPPSHFLHTWHGWWVNWSPDWPSSQRTVWPFVPQDAFWMSGYGKDICVVIPSLDMVIVHQTARAGGLEQTLSDCPEFFSTLFSKVMAAVVTGPPNARRRVGDRTTPASPSSQTTVTIERWDTYERSMDAAGSYANPFQDVRLTATFTHVSSGVRLTVDGFHDGSSTWRLRFMPMQLGTWRWTTVSNDHGLDGETGTLECVTPTKPYLHGPLMTEGFHFRHADGSRRFLISTRLSCQFDDPRNWDALVEYLKAHRINRVFFMLVANTSQSGLQWQGSKAELGRVLYGRDFDDRDASRLHLDAWRRIDNFVEKLRVNDIIASPYFYYFNDGFQWTMTPEQDDLFLRYGMARFGSFGNVLPVLGNQIDHKSQKKVHEGYDLDYTWQNEKGSLLKKLAVYGQPVTVHNPAEGRTVQPSFWTALFANPFPFADYLLKQGQVAGMGDVQKMDGATPEFDDDDGDGKPECSAAKDFNARAFARNNQFCLDMRNRYKIPIINEEPGYDFEIDEGYAWNAQNHNTIRATFWTAAMGGGYAAWGSKATYANGANRAYPQMPGNMENKSWGKTWSADPLRAMKLTPTALYLRIHHDFMAGLPYWEMTPDNSIVSGPTRNVEGEEFRTAFCLKKDNARYVVYALVGGKITMALPQGNWQVEQINPRDGSVTRLGTKSGGEVTIDLPESQPADFRRHTGDWVLSYQRATTADLRPTNVQRWDIYEATLTASGLYANPFQDVWLTTTFTHASSGARLTVDGFYDGGNTWRLRFMPIRLGTWHWVTMSNDRGLNEKMGTIECVTPAKPYLHGPLKVDGYHFVHADNTPRFLISTRLTCQFAPPSTWPPLIAFLKANRINRVLFMMPGVDSKKDSVYTQRNLFAPGPDYTRYHVEASRAIDEFIDTLRQADILASPYFYYDPRREVMWKMTREQDRAYLRYGMARLGAFSNVMPVLANEVELKTTDYKDSAFDLQSHAWANEMGAFLKSRVVFGQPVAVHNPSWHEFAVDPSYFTLLRGWPFAGWTDFVLKQVQMGSIGTAKAMTDATAQPKTPTYNERTYARRNQLLIDLRRFGQPVIDEEPGYDMGGTASAWNSQTPERMRPTFWTATTAGAYTVWGGASVYETGDPLPKMKDSVTPRYLRVLHDVMADLPYARMEPHNEIVTPGEVILDGEAWRTNFALARSGAVYLIYSLHGGSGTATLVPGQYSAVRVDPRDGTRTELGTAAGGTVNFSLPPGDWVLIYTGLRISWLSGN